MKAEWQWYDWERGHVYECMCGECVGACARPCARACVCVSLVGVRVHACVVCPYLCNPLYDFNSFSGNDTYQLKHDIGPSITTFYSTRLLVNTHECRFVPY